MRWTGCCPGKTRVENLVAREFLNGFLHAAYHERRHRYSRQARLRRFSFQAMDFGFLRHRRSRRLPVFFSGLSPGGADGSAGADPREGGGQSLGSAFPKLD